MSVPRHAERDRGIDGLRAYAIAGVVLGHWLVTALVLAPDGSLRPASPLTALPGLIPATWVLQTLGLFFFVSGYASARSLGSATARGLAPPAWRRHRLGRLVRPVAALLGCWAVVLAGAVATGVPAGSVHSAATLVVSPLWFLLPLVALIMLTHPLTRAVHRYGPLRVAGPAVALVLLSDLAGRTPPAGAPGLPPAILAARVPLAVLAAWLVPYLLGMALAGGRFGSRRDAWRLALGGAAGMAVLVLSAGYPASAVGVPGDGRSNLDPPSAFAVCLAVAQVGAALLVRPALASRLARPRWWRPVHRLNAAAMSVYLWHQSTLVGVAALAALGARAVGGATVPGLHSAPDGVGWLAARLAWLPLLGLVLAALVRPSRGGSAEQPSAPSGRAGCTMTRVPGPGRHVEVIAVRDSDPPSRGRADRQLR